MTLSMRDLTFSVAIPRTFASGAFHEVVGHLAAGCTRIRSCCAHRFGLAIESAFGAILVVAASLRRRFEQDVD